MIHGFLFSGLTETQYTSACNAAGIGSEGARTFDTGKFQETLMIVPINETCSKIQGQYYLILN